MEVFKIENMAEWLVQSSLVLTLGVLEDLFNPLLFLAGC